MGLDLLELEIYKIQILHICQILDVRTSDS